MKKPLFIARQSANPTGLLGRIVAKIMARDTQVENAAALEYLALQPDDSVLDFGCGHGRNLAMIAALVGSGGRVTGIDRSTVMVREALARNRRLVDAGIAEVCLYNGSMPLPFGDGMFDRITTLHTIYFIADLLSLFREFARLLKKDGRLLVGFQASDGGAANAALPEEVYRMRTADAVVRSAQDAGFTVRCVEARPFGKRSVTFLVAEKAS